MKILISIECDNPTDQDLIDIGTMRMIPTDVVKGFNKKNQVYNEDLRFADIHKTPSWKDFLVIWRKEN